MDCKFIVNKLKSSTDLVNGMLMDQHTLKNMHSNAIQLRNYDEASAQALNQCNTNDMDNSQKHNLLLFHQLNALQPYALGRFGTLDSMHFMNDSQHAPNVNLQNHTNEFQNIRVSLDENRARKMVTAEDCMQANNQRTSPTLSETSTHKNSNWSAEEQFKQVRQLYEINDDPKRKEFLDELFSFMQKRGTPISRLPIMAKSVLDLYELYNLVIARGGLVDVINKKLWQEIIKGLHLPSSITSAAFTLRTQYMRFLYPYECEKKNLSTPAELQAAVDSNRREGRRSNYYQTAGESPMYMNSLQQMSPFMNPNLAQLHNLPKPNVEERIMQYLNLRQAIDEYYLARNNNTITTATTTTATTNTVNAANTIPTAVVKENPMMDASNQALDLSKLARNSTKRENRLESNEEGMPPNKRLAIDPMLPTHLNMESFNKNTNQSDHVEAFLNFIKAWQTMQESQLQLIRGS